MTDIVKQIDNKVAVGGNGETNVVSCDLLREARDESLQAH